MDRIEPGRLHAIQAMYDIAEELADTDMLVQATIHQLEKQI
ncbi:hypothetical protein [Dictyobacter alpinus]|nr:hypothetical protein [Dictyobacter alpinus]